MAAKKQTQSIDRSKLAEAITVVAHGLSKKPLVRAFSQVFFDTGTMTAYDDIVAVSSPCELEILRGGVDGQTLSRYVGATGATEIEFDVKSESEVAVGSSFDNQKKKGKSKLKLPVCDFSEFRFVQPDDASLVGAVPLPDRFTDVIRATSLAMGYDPSFPWRLGITVAFEEDALVLYATDDHTVITCSIGAEVEEKLHGKSTILPPRFCEIVASVCEKKKGEGLFVGDGWVEIECSDTTTVFSRTLNDAEPSRFEDIIGAVAWEDAVEVPEGFIACLERCEVVLNDRGKCQISVQGDEIFFKAEGDAGHIDDRIEMEKQNTHPDVGKVEFDSRLLRRGLRAYARSDFKFLIAREQSCIILNVDDFYFMLSAKAV